MQPMATDTLLAIPAEQYKKAILAKVSVGRYKKGSYAEIPLLTLKELKNYFPQASIYQLKVTGFPIAEVLCAHWRVREEK